MSTKSKSTTLLTRLEPDELDRWRKLGKKLGITVSDAVRRGTSMYFDILEEEHKQKRRRVPEDER